MEIKTLNKIIATIQSVDSYYCMKEFMDVRILYRDDAIRTELIDIKLSNDSIDTKNTRIKSLICSHRFFKSRAQIPDNLFIYSLFPVPLFLTSCLKEFFVFSRLNENTNIPEGIEVLNTIENYEKIKDESLSLDIPSYNSFVDEFWLNCSNINDIGKVVVFYKNKLKDVILNFNLEAKAIKLMDENLSEFLEMGLMTDSIFKALSETYKIKIDEQFAYFDKINYFLEEAQYSMNPEDNPNYMGIRRAPNDDAHIVNDKYEYSEILLGIFKNDKKTLQHFLNRIKGKSGVAVVIEVQALMKLNKIRNEDVFRPLWTEITKIQDVKSESNWNACFGEKHTKKVEAIIPEYK